MRHDTFTTVPAPDYRTPMSDQAHDLERAAWAALADGNRTTAADRLADAAQAHADDAGTEIPDSVWLTQRGGTYRAAVCARIARELRGNPDPTDRDRPPAVRLGIAPPGWSMDFPPYTTRGGLRYGAGSLSGYGDDWTAHVHQLAPDAVVTVLRDIPTTRDLATLAISGPMPGAEIPAGMRDSLSAGLVPWRDVPQPDRDPRFGDARSFDRVGLDVYATIAERFGARILTVAELLAGVDIPTTAEARDRMAVA